MSSHISRLRRSRTARQVMYGGSDLVTFLAKDNFTTADDAPVTTPRTCEPGPGTLTFDGPAYYSIPGGQLNGASVLTGNAVKFDSQTRANGLAVAIKVLANAVSRTTGMGYLCGTSYYRFAYVSGSYYYVYTETSRAFSHQARASNVDLRWVVICRTDGYYFVDKVGTGNWELINAIRGQGTGGTGSAVLPKIDGPNNSTAEHAEFRVFRLGAPWNSQSGLADTSQDSYTANDVLTLSADGLMECMWTPGAGETLNIQFRRTDDNNHWLLECSQAASTIRVCEVNGGVNTQRSTTTQTWVVGTAYHLQVRAKSQDIRTGVNGSSKNYVSSASFNQTATGFKADLGLSNLALYPVALNTAARTELERFINA